VLKVDQVHVIRHKVLVEEVPIRRVAREMGVSRNTVRKYLGQAEPVRRAEKSRSKPVWEVVEPRIDAILEEWRTRTTAKQRVTAARLHRQLREEEYEVGLTLVQEVLREHRRRAAEVFIPLVHRPGDEAQVDFFEVAVDVAGARRKAWMFLLRLMYSGRDFARIYDFADQVSFLDGHVEAFEHLGAVPHRIIYDNLSSAVRRLVLPERELTARFVALRSHYLFEPCFARPGTGHDKGGVESRGKGIRLQHLVPIPAAPTLAEINEKLLSSVDASVGRSRERGGRSIAELFEEERPQMLPLAAARFEARKVMLCSVSRSAKVKINGASYSVPCRWKGLEATAYVGAADIRIVCRGETTECPRQPFGGQHVRYRHYLSELATKPQALRQVAAEVLSEIGEPYGAFWRLLVDTHGPREASRVFAKVIGAVVEHGEERVATAIQSALEADRTDLLALGDALRRPAPQRIEVPVSLQSFEVEMTPAAVYDALLAPEVSNE